MIGNPVSERDAIPVKKLCPCGCGRYLPEPVRILHIGPAGKAIEEWLADQGLTLEDIRQKNNEPWRVEGRRRIAKFLAEHDWGHRRIGEFLERDRTTVRVLLNGRKKA